MTAPITCAGCHHSYVESALFCPNCGRPKVRDATADALIGKVLGERFQILEQLGQGGSGTLYRGEHVTLRRKVAIKVLHEELSRDDLAIERFRREATTVAEIDNEHIVEIHDFGRTADGRLYLVMELLEGEALDSILAREKSLSIERTADILIQVGEALMEAHAIGYVHRDLRPRNIYLANRRGKANFVKLLDFGLAKLVESDASAASTSLGMTFGDPRYMSPEQARGDRIDRRADIYQLGCVAYEMLTGEPPFSGNRVFDILTKQVTEAPAPLPTRRPGAPLWMEAAVAKMLAKDPENRFATTTRLVEALRRGLETGEVMEDEVARRRESVPPPSVSRVMQKMGLGPDGAALKTGDSARGLAPAPDSTGKPDSVELLRKRTGTPQLGVPVVAAASASIPPAEQAPVAGLIEPKPARKPPGAERDPAFMRAPSEPARAKSPTSEPRARRETGDPLGISQAWYDEGDGEGAERSRKLISPSTTDAIYEEPPRRRWGVLFAALGAIVVIGGVAFALTRDKTPSEPAKPDPAPVATIAVDAAPATIITETPDAAVTPPPRTPTTPTDRTPTITTDRRTPTPIDRRTTPTDGGGFVPPGGEGPRRLPGSDPGAGSGSGSTTVIVTTPPPGNGSGVTSGPQDPYGGGGDTPPPDGGGGDKKAEFFANLGTQQLGSGDTTSAATSFKKALELDANNVPATIGMGEIALRQGLFGDAIAHLRKASRLAPKSSRVFTLLGEAYLNSGNSKEAANQFKKALQLDPDNARARDGYNEASSRVPPPSDGEE